MDVAKRLVPLYLVHEILCRSAMEKEEEAPRMAFVEAGGTFVLRMLESVLPLESDAAAAQAASAVAAAVPRVRSLVSTWERRRVFAPR